MARRGENIYKRKDGRWEGRYKIGVNADGKAKYSSIYGRSYSEVSKSLNKKKSEQANNNAVCKCAFGELADLWLENIRLSVKESTYANYMLKVRNHIVPVFGNIQYDNLTADILNNFVSKKLSDGLSVKYVSDIASVIKSICKFAHRKYNYSDKSELMTMPKKQLNTEKRLLSEFEQSRLNSYLANNPSNSNVGILLAAATGIRIGELCALKWSDIDFAKRIITVRATVQRIKNFDGNTATKIIITPPKSHTSVREIPIPDFIYPLLEKLRSYDDSYILSGSKKVTEPRTMQYRFKSILKKLNLTNVNFHALRHMFATGCAASGADAKTLSEILGHSSVEITLNRYVHSSLDRKMECMKKVSETLFKDYLPSEIPSGRLGICAY